MTKLDETRDPYLEFLLELQVRVRVLISERRAEMSADQSSTDPHLIDEG